MGRDFKSLSSAVMEHISMQGRGKETQRIYSRCFSLLGTYLDVLQQPYSPELADLWLNSVKGQTYKKEFGLFNAAIKKTNDLFLHGEIHNVHYDPAKTLAGKLGPEFRKVHQNFLVWLSDFADATIQNHSSKCAGILLRFQEDGFFSPSDITYELLQKEFFTSSNASPCTQKNHHCELRLLLQFLYEEYNAPFGYTLFVDRMVGKSGCFWNNVAPDNLAKLRNIISAVDSVSLEDYLLLRDSLYEEHVQNDYSATTLAGLRRITDQFYLFMDMNALRYTPQVGNVWLDSVAPYLDSVEYMLYRRILCLIEQRFEKNQFPLASHFSFKETAYSTLPDWCRADVDEFLTRKKNEGLAESSIPIYRSHICKFCSFLDAHGVRSFMTLTEEDIKEFNRVDKHRSPKTKNLYNATIRRFLRFLGEGGKLKNPSLFLSLSCVCAASESLVITLTEEEQEQLRTVFQTDNSDVSLRDKAMIQLGLYMGLRCSDIVKLTIDDIDWENSTLRVLQEKTNYEIILPMPTPVANSIYRYIMNERPASDTRNIFVRNCAPHVPVGADVCRVALKDALPKRNVPGSGFHVTRKTYGTNLLKNDTPPQQVAEVLGHRDLSTVHKYLSLDDLRMRQCGLSLADRNLSMKGGGSDMGRPVVFSSILAEYIRDFLAEKRSLGFIYSTEESILLRFDQYCIDNNLTSVNVSKTFLDGWCLRSATEGLYSQSHRISVVRQLMIYMLTLGIQVYLPKFDGKVETPVPHIFTEAELQSFFYEVDTGDPKTNRQADKRLVKEYRVLFRLIYCCGLRNSEASGIATAQVDLNNGVLTILNSKGAKDRLVYMAEDLTELCTEYYDYLCCELQGPSEWFFPGMNPEKPLPISSTLHVFDRY